LEDDAAVAGRDRAGVVERGASFAQEAGERAHEPRGKCRRDEAQLRRFSPTSAAAAACAVVLLVLEEGANREVRKESTGRGRWQGTADGGGARGHYAGPAAARRGTARGVGEA